MRGFSSRVDTPFSFLKQDLQRARHKRTVVAMKMIGRAAEVTPELDPRPSGQECDPTQWSTHAAATFSA